MDIEANLREQLELARSIVRAIDQGKTPAQEDSERLAELVMAAHNWRTVTAQSAQGAAYVPVEDPDSGLITLTP